MRSVSLAAVAAILVFVCIGFAQAAYLDAPAAFLRPLVAHKLEAPARVAGTDPQYYIVRLKDAPAATYSGGVADYEATDARFHGLRILDVLSPASTRYVEYLDGRQTELLDRAGERLGRLLQPRHRYHYAMNGMSLLLSRAEAEQLADMPGVVSVEPVRHYRPVVTISAGGGLPLLSVSTPASAADTDSSRSWIGAPTVWAIPTNSTHHDNEGEGVVVADIDTGINSGNSSFAATGPADSYAASDPGSLRFGVCDPSNTGQHSLSTPLTCNNKLIGAYSYTHGSNDPDSPEDSDGHGSHTASTAAGNFVSVSLTGGAAAISGVAPHASLIVYDVCDPTDQCSTDGSVKAVDQAIQDQSTLKQHWPAFKGMVINYSIGGTDDPYNDSVELAFLSAVEAGIYVSAAGGNGGPANAISNDPVNAPLYPVQHLGPWVATLAAATHNGISGDVLENFSGGTGTPSGTMQGFTGTAGVTSTDIVYSASYAGDDPVVSGTAPTSQETYPASQGPAANAQFCLYPFNPGIFTGKIVVCDRGTNPLADKAYNVEQGGAVGVVIVTTSSSSQNPAVETYVIPGTLITNVSDGVTLDTWLANNTASILTADFTDAALTTDDVQADQLAGFSSRGPTDTVYDSILKPDLAAPGVSVLAAFSNPKYTDGGADQPESYGFLDGTSMATPHDTGAGALLMQAHPSWTPSEVKSALMLTAVTSARGASLGITDQCVSLDSNENCVAGTSLPSPQVRGAGRIDVDAAERSGLVLDETGANYTKANPSNDGDLTTLNLASLGDNDCAKLCTWTRTVSSAFKNVTVTYHVSTSGASKGLSVSVSPASFSLAPGKTQEISIAAADAGVAVGHWAFAEVDITTTDTGDAGKAVPAMHMPVVVESAASSAHMSIAPLELDYNVAKSASQSVSFTISNNGHQALDWTSEVSGNAVLQASSPALSAVGAASPDATDSIWTQPVSGNQSGFPSTFYTQSGHGVYVADSFDMPVAGSITQIVAQGFAQDSSGPIDITRNVSWYIYATSSGMPKGNPEDGKNDYAWHYTASASSTGVSTAGGIISLDLAAAGQPAAILPPGQYWLIVTPDVDSNGTSSNAAAWFWFEGTAPDGSKLAAIDDPANIMGHGTGWGSLQASMAFSLSGTLDCGNAGMHGFSLSSTSGSVAAGSSETVTGTFSAGSQAAGTYTGGLCISSNAEDNPLIALRVSASVSGASGGGGGGGEMDLLSLAVLLAFVRRRSQH